MKRCPALITVAVMSIWANALPAAGDPPTSSGVLPAATAPPYPTIGRTRSKRYCALETERANGAVTVALTNDNVIAAGSGLVVESAPNKPSA